MKNEKVICLVSGGIDSPVACALVAEKFNVLPVHFCINPYTTEDNFLLTMHILENMKKKVKFEKIIVFPWARILKKISSDPKQKKYTCVACKKSMFKAAEIICEREEARGIVTGESLGQKASQTLQNLKATSLGIKLPILRPLLGFDKIEIEQMAKRLDLWYEVHAGDCYAAPKYPCTKTNPKTLDELLEKLNILDLIKKELANILVVSTFKEDFKSYLENLSSAFNSSSIV